MSFMVGKNSLLTIKDRIAPAISDIGKEHDLDGILSYVFDASHAGWNLASRARASPLLRRALAWFTILKMLALEQWDAIPVFYHGVSQFDADVATWVSEQLDERLSRKEKYNKPLVNLYTSVILSDHPAAAKTVTVSNLSSILEEQLSFLAGTTSEFTLPCDDLAKSFRPEADSQSWNRHATDAALRLHGCLLAVQTASGETQSVSSFTHDIHCWVVQLRSALSEETV